MRSLVDSSNAEAFADSVQQRGLAVAVAESMTAGALATAIVDIEGSGQWFRGGLVAYDSDTKYDVLGVTRGPVICASAAMEMATGIAEMLHAEIGIATTGCAGPEPMEEQPVGTVWIGLCLSGKTSSHLVMVGGDDPQQRRAAAVEAALTHAAAALRRRVVST
jgi:PncC family amidohydrolase